MVIKIRILVTFLVLTCFFFAGTQVQANSWKSLKDWMTENIKGHFDPENFNNIFSEQLQEIDNSQYSLEIREFFKSTTTSTKSNIQNHQAEYIQQLTQAKTQLKQNTLDSYYEERRSKLDEELTHELEQYLAELLDENNKP
ncbi:hypothetical protein FZC76_21220 [Sutcliffiella horikoshii]|uniref:Uncharacterized protein n=1 Tax=Sutcliffiella horikoshii TaxID=79883 RepID=A0A5D4SGV8_9BACI|nr:hypothetical protein [Sutcliffiella horikoshii]TYS62489.1 hypothetical protein FZC76_21220 [Sutcliffiella horikoshii]